MLNYIFKRLILGIISLLALVVIVWFLIYARKEYPINITQFENEDLFNQKWKEYGFDNPALERFWDYVKGIFTKFNFGPIYTKSDADSIPELFFKPLRDTAIITSTSFIISAILGITLGYIAGYNSGKFLDNLISFIVVMFMAIPGFVLCSIILILGPHIGLQTSFLESSIFGLNNYLKSIIAPILVLTITSLSGFTYYTRNEIKSILNSDYILNARSKGLTSWIIFKRYVVRNSAIPLIGLLIPGFIVLLGSSLIIEIFFNVPGTSSVIVAALRENETNVIMFNVLFFGFIATITRIIVDVMYVVVDPRIRYSTASANNLKLINRLKTFWLDPKTREELEKQQKINIKEGKDE